MELECGVGVCGSWLREQLALQLNSIWSSNGYAAAAQWAPLLHYLYPCYIHLYEEQPPIEECTGVFFGLISQLMSSHQDILLEDVHTGDVEIIELQIKMPLLLNKFLQVINSVLDRMNGDLCHKLAEIFLCTNWCLFDNSSNELSKTLVTDATNIYSNSWRLHYNMLITLLLKLTGINIVYGKDYIFETQNPALSKPFKTLIMVHRAFDQMYHALRLVNGTAEFKESMREASTIEFTLHPFRSYFYYILSRFYRHKMNEESIFCVCCQVYWTYWQALCKARSLISQEMAFHELPNNSFVAAFIRGDFEETNLLIEPILPYARVAEDHIEIYKTASDMDWEFPLMENNGQPVVNMSDFSGFTDSKGSDDGKKKPGKAKKRFKPPKEVIKALQDAQKPPNKALQEEEKPGIEALQEAQKQQNDIEKHTCNWCKKSVNENFLTCEECLKTEFPNVHYYCSKSCQAAAWETFHEEEHLISELMKNFDSM
ncbi:uncharacterized protein LOC135944181 [Cloeon dipterum]|uniref:uncharacterized protein LOC135944181 n=1 Tax=Cloeon dipterum TaxID=197152 RepID=UPI00321FD10B